MPVSEILIWLMKKVKYINEYKESVEKVALFNSTEEYFGKKYYRIYLTIEATPNGVRSLMESREPSPEAGEQLKKYYHASSDEYISFYSGYYSSEIVKVHYEWIQEVMRLTLQRGDYEREINNFERDDC